ncbi:ABC transporter substrate-binding protein [Kibdelosporangium aridum]|uniref:Peptide/nickel transport system substrate-binding protein n=1 Tax=Kibdelosporangium aridum TaxID=2030 RepID=A0A1W2B0Q7_KIBAR|nr:ABC transporter substrate-binding protein [Kibdelosporangium aridum]SMC66454.1 peptide/nickel transport system substrate-binding protein [Kibdelosporangium aridum]
MVRIVAFLLAVGMLATGCFAGSATNGDGRLRVVLPFPPAQAMSPWGDDALLLTRLGIAEPLVELDAGGKPVPGLAESWTRVDATTWRFRVRSGVKFHDGTTLTTQHVVDALTKAASASPVPRAVKGLGLTVKADGDRDVVVATTKPDAMLPQRLSSPNLVILAGSAGTGPFALKSLQGKDSAVLDAFAQHWAGAPQASGVDVRFVPDGTARAAALRAGEADVVHALPVAAAASLDARQLLEVPLPRTVSLHLNTSKPPFADAGLRAAARSTVDPGALAQGVYEGRADVARGIYGPASPWAGQRTINHPTAPATPSGQKIVLATYGDRAELPEVASVIAEALRAKGFVVEQVVREYSLLEPDLLAGKFDAVVSTRSYLLDTGDPFTYLATDMTCGGSYNLARLCDPAVDAAVGQGEDPLKVEAAVLATDALVPLVHERARIGVASGVTEVASDSFERHLITKATRRS